MNFGDDFGGFILLVICFLPFNLGKPETICYVDPVLYHPGFMGEDPKTFRVRFRLQVPVAYSSRKSISFMNVSLVL